MAAPGDLPPGVYFNPSPEECVNDYLVPWARGEAPPELGRFIFEESIYSHSPDALRLRHPPGTTRAFEPRWYFLSHCRFSGRRGGRGVATGGRWSVEQKSRTLDAAGDGADDVPGAGATRKSYGFYVGAKEKTPWLMEEFAAGDGGGRDAVVPVLCRIYVSPRASNDEKRAILGDNGVAVDASNKKKPERVVLHEAYFDALAERLPASCRRAKGGQAPPPPQHVPGRQPALPPPPVVPGHHHGKDVLDPPHHSQPLKKRPTVPVRQHGKRLLPPLPVFPDHDHRPAPSSVHGPPQQDEEEAIRAEKKPRLTTHHAQPQATAGDTTYVAQSKVVLQEPEPVSSPPPPEETLPFDACRAANESLGTSFMDPLGLPDEPDIVKLREFRLQLLRDDGEPLQPLDSFVLTIDDITNITAF